MLPASHSCWSSNRLVGDPVDVVTGAQTDITYDFKAPGPLPIVWNRYYSSARHLEMLPLGFGHTHEYDHRLTIDLDGLAYRGPSGEIIGLPDVAVGGREARFGFIVHRSADAVYQLTIHNGDVLEFAFSPGQASVPLRRLSRGEHSLAFTYNEAGRLEQIVDALKRSIVVLSDAAGQIVNVALLGSPGTATGAIIKKKTMVAYDYDPAGNLIRVKDTFGFYLSFEYDARRLLTRRTDRKGYSFLFAYDDLARCIHSKGEDGLFEVRLNYDPQVKATFVSKGGNPPFTYFYNDDGAITKILDPDGGATNFTLDELGRTVEEIDPIGNVTKLHYNGQGQHDYRIDPNGYILPTREQDPDPPDPLGYELPETPLQWEFGWLVDAVAIRPPPLRDRVLAQFPASVVNTVLGMTTTYDANAATPSSAPAKAPVDDDFGRPLEQPGPRSTERWKYDPNGFQTEHHDREGSVWKSVYESWNALRQEIDPLGHVTAFEHSQQGLVSKVTDPGGTVTEFGYDYKDRLLEVRRHGRIRENYLLDLAGNVVGKIDTGGRKLVTWEIGPGNLDKVRTLASGEQHVFEHDARGRITVAKAPSGEANFAYDEDGRTLADLRDGKGVVHELDLGQLVSTTYFGKFKVSYEIQDNGDLTVIDTLGGQHRIQRSDDGLIGKALGNGTRELCQFDDQGRCIRKALFRHTSASIPWMRSYAYSATGDLVGVSDTAKGQTKYTYDAAHRLAEETIAGSPSRRFTFDSAGNILAQPGLAKVVMDPGNRLREANGDRFGYNDRDHLGIRQGLKGTTRYAYDSLDMLVTVEVNGEPWTATYDPLCRRVTKTWLGRTTTYYWDDFRLAAEVRHDGSVRLYIHADEMAIVPLLFVEYASLEAAPESGKRYYIFTNQIGAPLRVEDDAGKVCWSARIDPYGRAEVSKDSILEMPLRFPGHYFDPETGLHYNRFRYYSPELGRYLQSDPVGLDGGINLYAYRAHPLTTVDLDGLGAKGGTKKEQALRQARAMCRKHPRGTKAGEDWRYKRYAARLALEKPPRTPLLKKDWKKGSKGGIRGSASTRADINKERDRIQAAHPNWVHTHGGTDAVTGAPKPELHVPGPRGGQKGSTRPDLTFQKPDGTSHHHNTVDTNADNTPTDREAKNLARLQKARPNDTTSISPKPK